MSEPEGKSRLVRVEIYGKAYSIRTEGSGDDIYALAEMLDRRMKEIARATLTVDSLNVAILAALHIAEDLQRARRRLDDFDHDLADRSARCAAELDKFLRRPNPGGEATADEP